nr:DUF3939 domain-containing protein [Mycobacterium sp. E3298]
MFIRCEKAGSGWGDFYWIENVQSIEELQEYLQNHMPVMGFKIDYRHKSTIVIKEDIELNLIYLNNYLNLAERRFYFMTTEEYNILNESKCKKCSNYDSVFGCIKKYRPDQNIGCVNYEETVTVSFKEWLKSKFQ